MLEKVNLADKFARVGEHWSPKIVAELNDAYVKVVKFEGEFVWHHHDDEDELFWVVSGRMRMELRDGDVTLGPGELIVVPRGVEHRPVAEEETHVVLIEPKTTLNTGNVRDERTLDHARAALAPERSRRRSPATSRAAPSPRPCRRPAAEQRGAERRGRRDARRSRRGSRSRPRARRRSRR